MADSQPVALVIGASRGIGRQIAITLALEGKFRVVAAAKTTSSPNASTAAAPFPPDPNSQSSTIHTVAREITLAGGIAIAHPVDVRSPESIAALFRGTLAAYGKLDAVVYNAGAIWWASVEKTPFKRFKLMQEVNAEGCYATVQEALGVWRERGWKGRMVIVSPPIYSRFFRGKGSYAMGKVGMSVLTKALAMDWIREGKRDMAVSSIWPAAAIESAATQQRTNEQAEIKKDLRKPTIFADAILEMLRAPAETVNGLLDLDEDFLRRQCGVTDFSKYALVKGTSPRRIMPANFPVLEVAEQDDEGTRMDSTVLRSSKL